MKRAAKYVLLSAALVTSLPLCARPGPGGHRPPPPRHHGGHHHHHHSKGFAVGAGILGGAILARTIYDATRPAPVVVAPAPVVVTPAPVVVQPAPVVVTPQPVVTTGHYENRVQNVWVEGRYIDQTTPQGTVIRTWQPGHYEQQTVQVWVP